MRIHYDQKVDVLSIRFSEKRSIESEEEEDDIMVDYNKHGKVVRIEILNASKVLPLKQTRQAPQPRHGWGKALRAMAQRGDDRLIE